MTAVQKIRCLTAEALLESLGTQSKLWANRRHFWIFRGHERDQYLLVPSALRADPAAQLGYTCAPKVGVQRTNREQIDAEFERLHEFYWSLDSQGLEVDGIGDLVRTPEGWRKLRAKLNNCWPIDELLPLLALAQHHLVPTRLLDWTDKPLVAAHFACKGAAKAWSGGEGDGLLGIWALNVDWILWNAFPSTGPSMSVYVVTAPRASNPNLHAQGGVFTTQPVVSSEFDKRVDVSATDTLVKKRWAKLKCNAPVMMHFTLPRREAGKVLRLLHQEGVSSATLYPGHQGVAESLAERALWDSAERASYWIRT